MQRFYVFFLVLCIFAINNVYGLNSSDVQITRVTGPAFNNQQGTTTLTGPGPHAAYVGFKIKNVSGATLSHLLADVYLFTTTPTMANNGGLALAGGQNRYQYIGKLAPNDSAVVFYYISYPVVNNIKCNINIKVTDNLPGFASYCGVVYTRSNTVLGGSTAATYNGHIDASACSVLANTVVGGIQKVTVKFDFSGIQSGHEINLQPAGNTSFNAGALQLVSAVVQSSTIPGIAAGGTAGVDSLGNPITVYLEQMYYLANGPAATASVTMDYYFQCQLQNVSTTLRPYGIQTNGGTIKYTENYGQASTTFALQTTVFPFTITKTSNAAIASANDIINYTITISNTSANEASFQFLRDTLPAGCTFLGLLPASDVTTTNSMEYPSASATGYIFWTGLRNTATYPYRSYKVDAGTSVTLQYQIQLPNNLGLNKYFLNKAYIVSGAISSQLATTGTCVSCLDQDSDGVFDMADKDDDNDGIEDYVEICSICYGTDPLGDDDNDFIINYLDHNIQNYIDTNGDGVNDHWDFDMDGIINILDRDSDGDGIADIVEAGGVDVDANGLVDDLPISANDADHDGVVNTYDADFAPFAIQVYDTDRDNQANFLDLDSDGDGVADICEVGGCAFDTDGNGRIDAAVYSGNNTGGLCGCVTGSTNTLVATSPDIDFDGMPNGYTNDVDGDNKPNFMDIDSDGDGIVDVLEFQATPAGYNATQIMFPDAFDGLVLPIDNTDLNGDGWLDAYPTGAARIMPIDTDLDGTPDFLDDNSDNDTYSDFIEGNDLDHNHVIDNVSEGYLVGYFPNDVDNDGLDDVFDLHAVDGLPNFWDNARSSNSAVAPANQFGLIPVFRSVANAFPVTLLGLNANFVNNQVVLDWATASEINLAGFEVYRSVDGINYSKLGTKTATNQPQGANYQFIDNQPLINEAYVLYYRLKMLDNDGAYKLSNVAQVNIQTNASILLSVYPNPASENVKVDYFLKSATDAKITVRNAMGKEVYTQSVTTANSWQNVQIPVKNWAAGVYFISINDGISTQVSKVVVE